MAFAATASTSEPRAFSIGTQRIQIFTWTAISGDTSGTVSADRLTSVTHVLMDGGLVLSAAPTFSGSTVTLAFNDPVASVFGTLIVVGK